MTDLIDVVQKIEPGSELVHLFELTLPNGTVLYFHPGFETDVLMATFILEKGREILIFKPTSPFL